MNWERPGERDAMCSRTRGQRVVWATIGLGSTGVGAVGVVVPGLPSTVFFLFALFCFSRSSERLKQWLLSRPIIGNTLREYREKPGMSVPMKRRAIVMLVASVGVSAFIAPGSWLPLVIIATGLFGAGFIWWRVPNRRTS